MQSGLKRELKGQWRTDRVFELGMSPGLRLGEKLP